MWNVIVTEVEVKALSKHTLFLWYNWTNIVKKFDPEKSKVLDVRDFIACCAETSGKSDNKDEIKNAFSIFDKDGSGMLRIAEVRHVLNRIGDTMTNDDIDKFLEIVDRHNDGFIR